MKKPTDGGNKPTPRCEHTAATITWRGVTVKVGQDPRCALNLGHIGQHLIQGDDAALYWVDDA